jgi:hypothetical protein
MLSEHAVVTVRQEGVWVCWVFIGCLLQLVGLIH